MSDTTVIPAAPDYSMAEISAMLSDAPPSPDPVTTAPEPVEPEPEPIIPEAAAPAVDVAAGNPPAESGTAKIPEPETSVEEKEEPLPPNVQKRIAKEVATQARIDREIAEAVSTRKAKEAELARLKADPPSGSDPVKQTPQAPAKPVKPNLNDFTGDDAFAEYAAAEEAYQGERDKWLIAETRKAAAEEFTAKQREAEGKRDWEAAVKTLPDLPAARDAVVAAASENFVVAVSQLDNWPAVTAHLGTHADELKTLNEQFQKNPYAAVAALGKLEDRLTQVSKPAAIPARASDPPLPAPPTKVGGAVAAVVDIDLEKASTPVFNREFAKMLRQ